VEGKEVVQLYVRDDVSTVTRPIKELKGFKKISLKPGEEQTVTFTIDRTALKYFNRRMQEVVEPGTFTLMVGPNSTDLQEIKFTVK
jgi:beta-glucosidase